LGCNNLPIVEVIVPSGLEGFEYRNHEIQNKFIHYNHIFLLIIILSFFVSIFGDNIYPNRPYLNQNLSNQ